MNYELEQKAYEAETKEAYQNKSKAKAYRDQYTTGFKWARFTMWRQKKITFNLLSLCKLESNHKILDIPCGAGLIGDTLSKFKASVSASDISEEMMILAEQEYDKERFDGFFQADITDTPFSSDEFRCVIVLSLMHRLPKSIRKQVLDEVKRITNSYIIISYSEENLLQKAKQWILLRLKKSHKSAPSSIPFSAMTKEILEQDLRVIHKRRIFFLFSSQIIFLLEKI